MMILCWPFELHPPPNPTFTPFQLVNHDQMDFKCKFENLKLKKNKYITALLPIPKENHDGL